PVEESPVQPRRGEEPARKVREKREAPEERYRGNQRRRVGEGSEEQRRRRESEEEGVEPQRGGGRRRLARAFGREFLALGAHGSRSGDDRHRGDEERSDLPERAERVRAGERRDRDGGHDAEDRSGRLDPKESPSRSLFRRRTEQAACARGDRQDEQGGKCRRREDGSERPRRGP